MYIYIYIIYQHMLLVRKILKLILLDFPWQHDFGDCINKQTHLSYHSGSRIAYPKPRSQAQIGQMLSSPSLVFKKLVQAQAHRSKILKTSTALQVSSFLLFMFIERSKWYCSNGCLCLTLPARHWHWRLAFCLRSLTGEVQRQQLMEIHTFEFVYSHCMNLK